MGFLGEKKIQAKLTFDSCIVQYTKWDQVITCWFSLEVPTQVFQ